MLELLAPKAAEKNVDLSYFADDTIPKILVSDVTRLKQILVNLIGNAVKFTAQGEVAIEVKPAAHGLRRLDPGREPDTDFIRHPQQWLLHFSVRDTGIGIPLDKQSRLFKSFQQVDASTTRQYGGTGLGLAICKRLAELMGGSIWVESDTGKGATFHFTILANAASSTLQPHWQQPQPQLSGKRVLIVEDSATLQRIIRHRLTQWGMNAESATNHREALAALSSGNEFEVAVIDLQLPEKDGLLLISEIRAHANGRFLPIILISSSRLRSDDPRPSRAGVSAVISKPIRPAQLLEAFAQALNLQLQREKKTASTPSLDATLASRLPLRILLADDNLINQRVGQSVLNKLGYRPELALNGLDVLKALEQEPFDLLFLDVQMPEMDGLEVARRINEQWPIERRPRIIAMTGNALMGDREKCLNAGMDDYISKPIRIAELQAAIERWGPTKIKRTADTTSFLRRTPPAPADLLDSNIIAELREMPPTQGVSMLRELIDLFLESAPKRIEQIRDTAKDPTELAFHAHALKSMSLNLGAQKIVELTKRLEEMGRRSDTHEAATVVTELQNAFVLTRAQLEAIRETA
ncbi:MAG TPA: response regulator [Verrucomicrobiae bacterium]|nr:response regulator [Verrucomicrobiae bacterium]